MDPTLAAALISAGGNLLGGSMQQSTADQNRAVQMQIAQQNINAQRDFAQHGVSWKEADAVQGERDYGINKLVGMGASTIGFSPVSVGDLGGNPMGAAVSAAGQNLSRAAQALLEQPSRADLLNEKLLEAKIANVNADTVRMTAAASEIATRTQPGSGAGVPLPPDDPRGPVIPLMQRARDPRTGEIVWIPSEKAASPLQTLGAMPTNAALAGRAASEGLIGYDNAPISWGLPEWLGSAARQMFYGRSDVGY